MILRSVLAYDVFHGWEYKKLHWRQWSRLVSLNTNASAYLFSWVQASVAEREHQYMLIASLQSKTWETSKATDDERRHFPGGIVHSQRHNNACVNAVLKLTYNIRPIFILNYIWYSTPQRNWRKVCCVRLEDTPSDGGCEETTNWQRCN